MTMIWHRMNLDPNRFYRVLNFLSLSNVGSKSATRGSKKRKPGRQANVVVLSVDMLRLRSWLDNVLMRIVKKKTLSSGSESWTKPFQAKYDLRRALGRYFDQTFSIRWNAIPLHVPPRRHLGPPIIFSPNFLRARIVIWMFLFCCGAMIHPQNTVLRNLNRNWENQELPNRHFWVVSTNSYSSWNLPLEKYRIFFFGVWSSVLGTKRWNRGPAMANWSNIPPKDNSGLYRLECWTAGRHCRSLWA